MDENLRAIGRISQEGTPQYNRGTNYFLGIGIDAYNAPLSKLRNCVRDVTVVRDVLVGQYDFEEENVFVLPEKEATRKICTDIRKAIFLMHCFIGQFRMTKPI